MDLLERWLNRWAGLLERYLFGSSLLFFSLLVAAQLAMTHPKIRSYLNRVDFIEGVPYRWPEEITAPSAGGAPERPCAGPLWIELCLREGTGNLAVLRNGVTAGFLRPEGIVISVNPGDLLEVCGAVEENRPAVVEVTATGGLELPRAGELIETFGDRDLIGWAVPREE